MGNQPGAHQTDSENDESVIALVPQLATSPPLAAVTRIGIPFLKGLVPILVFGPKVGTYRKATFLS